MRTPPTDAIDPRLERRKRLKMPGVHITSVRGNLPYAVFPPAKHGIRRVLGMLLSRHIHVQGYLW